MKNALLILFSAATLTACNNANNAPTAEEVPAVGGQKSAHGCLVGAGETWSELKQSCVQIFKEGQRLSAVAPQTDEAEFSAFVLINEDKFAAELFLPNTPNSVLLKTSDNVIFEAEVYKFDSQDASLYIDGTKVYEVKH